MCSGAETPLQSPVDVLPLAPWLVYLCDVFEVQTPAESHLSCSVIVRLCAGGLSPACDLQLMS